MKRMKLIVDSIGQASGARAELKFEQPAYSTTVNGEALGRQLLPALEPAAATAGGRVALSPKGMASEDFSEFQKRVPGVFFFVGATWPGADPAKAAPNHSPKFEIDEGALAVGVKAMVGTALASLGGT